MLVIEIATSYNRTIRGIIVEATVIFDSIFPISKDLMAWFGFCGCLMN